MAKSYEEMMSNYQARIKRQNDKVKEEKDRISATLPLGTVERIKALGVPVNKVINDCVLAFLEYAEAGEDEDETLQNPPTTHQKPQIDTKTITADKIPDEAPKSEIEPIKKPETQEEMNARLEVWQKQLEAESIKQQQEQAEKEAAALKRKQEESESFKDGLRKRRAAAKAAEAGEPAQEEPEKEYKLPIYYDQFGNVIENPMQTAAEKAKREQEEHERVVAANRETERRNYGVWYRGHEPEPAEQDFEPMSAESIKAMLQNPEFRQAVESPIYKEDFINNYGVENYERVQEQLKEYRKDQKELKRAESLAKARAEDNAE